MLETDLPQIAFLLFVLWTLVASIYLVVRPEIERAVP